MAQAINEMLEQIRTIIQQAGHTNYDLVNRIIHNVQQANDGHVARQEVTQQLANTFTDLHASLEEKDLDQIESHFLMLATLLEAQLALREVNEQQMENMIKFLQGELFAPTFEEISLQNYAFDEMQFWGLYLGVLPDKD